MKGNQFYDNQWFFCLTRQNSISKLSEGAVVTGLTWLDLCVQTNIHDHRDSQRLSHIKVNWLTPQIYRDNCYNKQNLRLWCRGWKGSLTTFLPAKQKVTVSTGCGDKLLLFFHTRFVVEKLLFSKSFAFLSLPVLHPPMATCCLPLKIRMVLL